MMLHFVERNGTENFEQNIREEKDEGRKSKKMRVQFLYDDVH